MSENVKYKTKAEIAHGVADHDDALQANGWTTVLCTFPTPSVGAGPVIMAKAAALEKVVAEFDGLLLGDFNSPRVGEINGLTDEELNDMLVSEFKRILIDRFNGLPVKALNDMLVSNPALGDLSAEELRGLLVAEFNGPSGGGANNATMHRFTFKLPIAKENAFRATLLGHEVTVEPKLDARDAATKLERLGASLQMSLLIGP